jgi:hypothetical protein
MAGTRGWTGGSDRTVYALARISGTAPPTFLSRDCRLSAARKNFGETRLDQGVASVSA